MSPLCDECKDEVETQKRQTTSLFSDKTVSAILCLFAFLLIGTGSAHLAGSGIGLIVGGVGAFIVAAWLMDESKNNQHDDPG